MTGRARTRVGAAARRSNDYKPENGPRRPLSSIFTRAGPRPSPTPSAGPERSGVSAGATGTRACVLAVCARERRRSGLPSRCSAPSGGPYETSVRIRDAAPRRSPAGPELATMRSLHTCRYMVHARISVLRAPGRRVGLTVAGGPHEYVLPYRARRLVGSPTTEVTGAGARGCRHSRTMPSVEGRRCSCSEWWLQRPALHRGQRATAAVAVPALSHS
jgi:hypothetical protein